MTDIVISGSGLYTPKESISNEELVHSFNQYIQQFNEEHKAEIATGEVEAKQESSAEFIIKASGIKSRYVMEKAGILDPKIMMPQIPERPNDMQSIQCEMGVAAALDAMQKANKDASQIDAVFVGCSNFQRAYPAVAVEIQNALGIEGFAVDMNMACSSATFGIQAAVDSISNNKARAILIINPEICTAHLNFRDRDSHFIFGDVCTAVVIENKETCTSKDVFEIIDTKLRTSFSNNIRNNFGFLSRPYPETILDSDKLFIQQGRKVFKEVIPMVAQLIKEHMAENNLDVKSLKRAWLHQANLSMNQLISKKVLGVNFNPDFAPTILDEYANTSSAGSIVTFHKHHDDLKDGELGIICSFGAGYSVGNVILKRITL